MKAVRFTGANLRLTPPKDWDEAKHGPCETIYGHRDLENHTTATVWEFTDAERAQIAAGQNLVVTHPGLSIPPMVLEVADIPALPE